MKRTLLLVDDEENIVSSLVRLLRRDNYSILSANSGKEGLAILAQHPEVGVVISDQRMPEMMGVEFLSQVKMLYPDTVRIVLSGYTDLASVTDAINRGAIYKFLTKPWEDDLLRAHIEEAFRHFEMVSENERLASELKAANEALLLSNHKLVLNVEAKAHEIMRNLDILHISQEILEHLPVAVLGIGEDDIIAIANRRAHELLDISGEEPLLGAVAGERLAPDMMACLTDAYIPEMDGGRFCRLPNGLSVYCWCYPMGQYSYARGNVLVIALQQGMLM